MTDLLGKPLWDATLKFWFDELKPRQWFVSSKELDQTISDRFSNALYELSKIKLKDDLSESDLITLNISGPLETLAVILITDQFSRNIHRGSAQAFATDDISFSLANHLINTDQLSAMKPVHVQFAVMPLMHAENLTAQTTCVSLFKQYEIEQGVKSAIEHRDIIEQFGRFPHRNRTLGRTSTPEEIEYLKDGNAFGQA